MKITKTNLKDCFVLEPKVYEDERGYFMESFNQKRFLQTTDINIEFIQDNESKSSKGVLRGLHFQTGDFAQTKLVRVIKGRVQDVVVDLRPGSLTYGHHFSIELSETNKKQLFIPKDFAHGFLVLENETIFNYKCDNYYHPESENGIHYNDKDLNIDWMLPKEKLIISEKDAKLPLFKAYSK